VLKIRCSAAFSMFLLLYVVSGRSQQSDKPSIEENLYSKALFASVAAMDKSWSYIDDSYMGGVRTDYHHMRVEKRPGITDDLPAEVGDYQVEYLDIQGQIDKYKKLGKGFSILGIAPIQTHGTNLKIFVTVYYVRYAKGRLISGISDWSEVTFRYDCEKQNFVMTDLKLGGI
jgi:hypothetical protein